MSEIREIADELQSSIKSMGETVETHHEKSAKAFADHKSELARETSATKKEFEAKLEKIADDYHDKDEKSAKAYQEKLDLVEAAIKASAMHQASVGGEAISSAEQKEFSVLLSGARNENIKELAPLAAISAYKEAYGDYLLHGVMNPEHQAALAVGAGAKNRFTGLSGKSMEVGRDPDGGYFVHPELTNIIIKKAYDMNPMRQVATIRDTTKDSVIIILDRDEASVNRVSEKQASSETDTPVLGSLEIAVHAMDARPKLTQEMIDDAGFAVEPWLGDKVSDKMVRIENIEHFTGSGVGEGQGILTYAAGTDFNSKQVEQVNVGSSGMTYLKILALTGTLKEAYQPNASWLMKRSSLTTLMGITDGDSSYLFATAVLKDGVRTERSLAGYPLRTADGMAAITSNSLSYAFGDFKKAYMILNRKGLVVIRDPFSSKPFIELYYRLRSGSAVFDFDAYKIGKCA